MLELTREFHDGVDPKRLLAQFGNAVLLPQTGSLPIQEGLGNLSALPPAEDNDAEVVLHIETPRPDTGLIVWFAATYGRFSDQATVQDRPN